MSSPDQFRNGPIDETVSGGPGAAKALTDSRLAALCADATYRAFLNFHAQFRTITRQAKERFLARDWTGSYADAKERLGLYSRVLDRLVGEVRQLMGGRLEDKTLWAACKAVYSSRVTDCQAWEITETFFNSLTRRVFATVGVNQQIEFVDTDFDAPPTVASGALRHCYHDAPLPLLLSAILTDAGFAAEWYYDLPGTAAAAAARVEAALGGPATWIEVVKSVFFRGKGAYLIGCAFSAHDGSCLPFGLVLLHGEAGIVLDAVLTGEDDLAILFSFTRSYFRVDVERPYELVRFLKALMPRKRLGELYTAIGYHKHGKTEFYRDFLHHLRLSADRFETAQGARGMVMMVFTLPAYDVVFKVIKDRFDYPKTSSRMDVMGKYRLVFEHNRAGRLVEAYEYEHLRIEQSRFRPDLLQELLRDAGGSVRIEEGHVVIRHVYMERRVRPLNLYLSENSDAAARAAVRDYGQAIWDLAATNIFPGDLFLKNFGVTRHGRVVFYDYDELCLLTDCNFRELPSPTSYEEEIAPEPWFSVREGDVFPKEFPRFLGLRPDLREELLTLHGDLFTPEPWRRVQTALREGIILEVLPYDESKRLTRPYGRRAQALAKETF
jgi:isocitrate dehydrogenase kinase/phosphatase